MRASHYCRPGHAFGHADRGLFTRDPEAGSGAGDATRAAKSGWTSFADGFIESRFKADPMFARAVRAA